jgi:hypothetical protein
MGVPLNVRAIDFLMRSPLMFSAGGEDVAESIRWLLDSAPWWLHSWMRLNEYFRSLLGIPEREDVPDMSPRIDPNRPFPVGNLAECVAAEWQSHGRAEFRQITSTLALEDEDAFYTICEGLKSDNDEGRRPCTHTLDGGPRTLPCSDLFRPRPHLTLLTDRA